MIITIIAGGQSNRQQVGQGTTVGDLFGDPEFREDFNVADRAVPQVNGDVVDNSYTLQDDDVVKPIVPASSKSI